MFFFYNVLCVFPISVYVFVRAALVAYSTSLCGRDGRTICGPLCVPKSTYVTLAHKRKQKFFYFGSSLVRRFYCKKVNKNNNGTDGQTDGQTDRQSATQYAAPSYGGGPHIINNECHLLGVGTFRGDCITFQTFARDAAAAAAN